MVSLLNLPIFTYQRGLRQYDSAEIVILVFAMGVETLQVEDTCASDFAHPCSHTDHPALDKSLFHTSTIITLCERTNDVATLFRAQYCYLSLPSYIGLAEEAHSIIIQYRSDTVSVPLHQHDTISATLRIINTNINSSSCLVIP